MILAKLTKAVRKQNYYAVVLEFLIVIAGVVIGFQIQGWSEDRQEMDLERELINRIKFDLAALSMERADLDARLSEVLLNLAEVHKALDDASEVSVLSDEQCGDLALSHLVPRRSDGLPAIDQLTGSGQREIIADPDLDAAITRFLQARQQFRDNYESLNRSPNILPSRFPALMRRRIDVGADGSMDFNLSCDLPGMRASQGFRNDLVNNTGRLIALRDGMLPQFEGAILELSNALQQVHEQET